MFYNQNVVLNSCKLFRLCQAKNNFENVHIIQIPLRMLKYHPGLSSPFIHSVVSIDSVRGQRRPESTEWMHRLI